MARSWLSAQWHILGVSSHSIAGYSHCSPHSWYLECPVGGMIIHSPNGRFLLAAYWLSVMSFTNQAQSSASIVAHHPWWSKQGQHPRVPELSPCHLGIL